MAAALSACHLRTHRQATRRDASSQDTSTLRQPGAQSISPVVNENGSGRPTANGLTKFKRTMMTLRLRTSGRIPLDLAPWNSLAARLRRRWQRKSRPTAFSKGVQEYGRWAGSSNNSRFQNTIRPGRLTVDWRLWNTGRHVTCLWRHAAGHWTSASTCTCHNSNELPLISQFASDPPVTAC